MHPDRERIMSTMTNILLLRLDAPLMSFGAPVVDERGKIQPFPAQSLLTGLLANALGVDRGEHEKLERLQRRLRYAVREDRRGQKITDFQTVDLTTPHMSEYVWTTAGAKKRRTGKDREILYRDYWADAVYTVALTLDPASESPTLADVSSALSHPARPLFIGRKTCLPASSLHMLCAKAENLVEALQNAPLVACADKPDDQKYSMWWPAPSHERSRDERAHRQSVTDRRDWKNQIHVGERWVHSDRIVVSSKTGLS